MKKEYVNLYDAHGRSLGATNRWQVVPDVADYIIFKSGELIKAKSGDEGRIIYADSDFSKVMNYILSVAKQSEDDMRYANIYIKSGVYTAKNLVDIPIYSWISIIGSGISSTIIKVSRTGIDSFSEENALFRYLNTSASDIVMDSANYGGEQPIKSNAQYLRISDMTIDTTDEKYVSGIVSRYHAILQLENLKLNGYFYNSTPNTSTYVKGIYIRVDSNIQTVVNNVYLDGYYMGIYAESDHFFSHSITCSRNYIGMEVEVQIGTIIKPHFYTTQRYGMQITGKNNFSIVNPSVESVLLSYGYEYYVGDHDFDNACVINPRHVTIDRYLGGYWDRIKWIKWKEFQYSGVSTFSGDGSTTQFTIPHGLVAEPSKVQVTPMSADAAGDFYVTKDATNIYVNYKTAPASGSDNVVLSWYAEI